MYGVYVKLNIDNCIIAVNSSAHILNTVGWIEIDRGNGDKFYHAQGNYFPESIIDERGAYRYKADLINNVSDARTVIHIFTHDGSEWAVYESVISEIEDDEKGFDSDPSDLTERVSALEAAMKAIEEGILSV